MGLDAVAGEEVKPTKNALMPRSWRICPIGHPQTLTRWNEALQRVPALCHGVSVCALRGREVFRCQVAKDRPHPRRTLCRKRRKELIKSRIRSNRGSILPRPAHPVV